MSRIFQFIKTLLPNVQSTQDRDEAYLAEAVDVFDLERRMRQIDSRASTRYAGQRLAAGM